MGQRDSLPSSCLLSPSLCVHQQGSQLRNDTEFDCVGAVRCVRACVVGVREPCSTRTNLEVEFVAHCNSTHSKRNRDENAEIEIHEKPLGHPHRELESKADQPSPSLHCCQQASLWLLVHGGGSGPSRTAKQSGHSVAHFTAQCLCLKMPRSNRASSCSKPSWTTLAKRKLPSIHCWWWSGGQGCVDGGERQSHTGETCTLHKVCM
jgi:hypothetical protein